MKSNPKKHIIDSLLREIYGEKSPPDQTEEIMRRLAENDQTLKSDSKLGSPLDSGLYPAVKDPVILGSNADDPATQSRLTATRLKSSWIVVAASVLFAIGLVGVTIKILQDRNNLNNVADLDGADDRDGVQSRTDQDSDATAIPPNGNFKAAPKQKVPQTDLAQNRPTSKKSNTPDQVVPQVRPAKNLLPTFAENVAPVDLSNIKTRIDSSFAEIWHVNVIDSPTKIAKDEWLGRVFEWLLGRSPESHELEPLQDYLVGDQIPSLENQIKIIEILINDDRFAREFSNRWADKFLELVVSGSPVQKHGREYRALQTFLRESFSRKKSLDEIVSTMLSASGSVDPQALEYNPAAGYVALTGRNPNRLTESVSRAFLGTELVCARCHTDSFYEQSQKDYLGLAAFFQKTHVDRKATGVSVVTESESQRKLPGLFYHDKNGIAVYSPPQIAGHDAQLDQKQARQSAATQLVKSDRFAKAMVNWVWTEIYGYGLARPGRVNQFANAPHQPLLAELAEQLVAHDFDYRVVVKWAALSEAFSAGRNPSADTLAKDIPKYGGVPFFSYVYGQHEHDPADALTRLAAAYQKPEGLSETARISLNVKRTAKGIEIIDQVKNGVLPNGLKVDDEIPDFAKGWGLDSKSNSILQDIASSESLTFDDKVEHLYLLAMKRSPSRAEQKQLQSLLTLQQKSSNAKSELEVLQDVWWAIYSR